MKDFFKRAGIFAMINALLIGLLKMISILSIDTCIIYCTILSIIAGFAYEIGVAIKNGDKPNLAEMFGASIFGSIVAAFLIYSCVLIF